MSSADKQARPNIKGFGMAYLKQDKERSMGVSPMTHAVEPTLHGRDAHATGREDITIP